MKIIIAGAGEVGTHLAEMLAYEEQDITLLDINEKKLDKIKGRIEALTMEANPLILEDLEKAAVSEADLFVSVTPEGATNLMACTMAKRVGAKKTIARVNTHEYLEPEYTNICEDLGIDGVIYPEDLAAQEIASTTLNPWARQYVELFNGAIVLIGVKVRKNAVIVGKRLKELQKSFHLDGEKFCHLVAIKRDLETLIPNGDTLIETNDLVFFTCLASHVDGVRLLAGKENPEVNKIVIMGASRVARQTIKKVPEDIQISVIEQDKDKSLRLSQEFPHNVEIYQGDGRDPAILEEAGLEDAQVFIALTENSETNVLACLAAKRYNVFKTIAKEENIDYIPLAYRLDIGTLINKKLLAAGHIYRMLLGEKTNSIICLSLLSNAEIAELEVERNSPLIGKSLREIELPSNVTCGGMLRNGVPYMVSGETVIEAFDHIIIFYHDLTINKLRQVFK